MLNSHCHTVREDSTGMAQASSMALCSTTRTAGTRRVIMTAKATPRSIVSAAQTAQNTMERARTTQNTLSEKTAS